MFTCLLLSRPLLGFEPRGLHARIPYAYLSSFHHHEPMAPPAEQSKLTVRDECDPGHTLDLGVTVDEAVSFIVEALEDPLNPRWCGPSITACMVVIKMDHNTAEALINGN